MVAQRSAYYRDRLPRDRFPRERFPELPILEKAALQDPDISATLLTCPPQGLGTITSSGSTGQPVRVWRSATDQAELSAVWSRAYRAYGMGLLRQLVSRKVNVGSGRPAVKQGPATLLRKLGIGSIHQLSSFDPTPAQLDVLRSVKPEFLTAYGIAMELLAEAVIEAGITDIRPRLLYTSGTPLSPRGQELAERAFGMRPYDVYAANEVGPIAWECPIERGTLHLNDDTQIVELVDDEGNVVPDGETGQVVVTPLLCLSQPLIRYRVGDLARRLGGACSCRRGLGRLSPVQGRTQHLLMAPDGRTLNTVMVSAIMGPFSEVRRYQVRQPTPEMLEIADVPHKDWTPGARERVKQAFHDRLGTSFDIRIAEADDLPLAPSGKFQTIVPYGGAAFLRPPPAPGSELP